MNEQEVLKVLGEVGAVIADSHIVYTSGKHGTAYVDKNALYPHTAKTSRLCRCLAERFADDNVEVVIGPAIGGVILSQWTAHHLSEINGYEVLAVYADKVRIWVGTEHYNQIMIRETLHRFIQGKRILVVDDVMTTGGSTKRVVEATRAIGGNVIGLGVLCNRGGITPQDVADVPKLTALVDVKLDAYDEATCPLCERKVPINTNVGEGREFLDRQNANTSHG